MPTPGCIDPKKKPLIAVVDDDRSVLTAVGRLLRSTGYAVSVFDSAQAFLENLPNAPPECLVLDVQMPGMNGFELQARLQALNHSFPILFITAYDSPQTRAAAAQSGCIGLVFKPCKGTDLIETIGRVCKPG